MNVKQKWILFILIISLSESFAQSQTYEDSLYYIINANNDTTEVLWYRLSSAGFRNYFEYYDVNKIYSTIEYRNVKQIRNTKGYVLYPELNIRSVSKINLSDPNSFKSAVSNNGRIGFIGGAFIAFGGGLLLSNIEKDLEDYDSVEDLLDSTKTTARIGYGFIIIGGILVALGI